MQKRKNHTQIADKDELVAMIDSGGKRKPLREESFVDYSTVIKWLEYLDIDPSYFTKQDFSLKDYNKESIDFIKYKTIKLTLEKVREKQLLTILKEVTNYLNPYKEIQKSDIIFVFGGKDINRIKKGIELYKLGFAPKILVSGRSPFYVEAYGISEAERFKDRAIKSGIPEEAILIENQSVNISDNIKRSLDLLDEKQIPYKSIIQVIAWYAQRRAWGTLMRYSVNGTESQMVNPESSDPELTRDNWYKTKKGIEIVINEFFKMRPVFAIDLP
jgi:hypothetical protein